MFTRGSLLRGDVNDVIYDAEGTREWAYTGTHEHRYGFTCGPMCSRERAVTGLESGAVSAQVAKLFVLFLVKHIIKLFNIKHIS